VHPFWLSHEEKRHWLELFMEGHPWRELELQGRRHGGAHRRGEREGRRGGEVGAAGAAGGQ
jgi:hypothetical protein